VLQKFKENEKPRNQARARRRRQKEALPASVPRLADKSQKIWLLGQRHFPVRVSLVVEFEGVIGVGEVLFRLYFVFSVGFNPVKKLCAFLRVTGLSVLLSLQRFGLPRFLV